MGNVCVCCKWGRGGHDAKGGKKEIWFDEDSKPLVTAKHDLNEIGSNEADGQLRRKVLIRSPRPASASAKDFDGSSTRPSRHQLQQHEHADRPHYKHRAKAASADSSSYSKRSKYSNDRIRPRCSQREADDNDKDNWKFVRAASLEVQDSRAMRTLSSPARSPRVVQFQDAVSLAAGEAESVDSLHGSIRSHRSTNGSMSPKASSNSNSPHTKSRYGRKHYRADVNRK